MVNRCWIKLVDRGIPNGLTVEVERHRDSAPTTLDSLQPLFDLLSHTKARATFFVQGKVAEKRPEILRAIVAGGHELGCHGYAHRSLQYLTPTEFRTDLRQARAVLQDQSGVSVDTYRAPNFSVTPDTRWALDLLIEEGFLFDGSIHPTTHDRTGVMRTPLVPYLIRRPGGNLWEFPPPVLNSLGSRRFDLYALTRHGLHAANTAGRPFIASLRAWELDGQRRERSEERLRRLLSDFAFVPLPETLARWCERGSSSEGKSAA